MKNSTNEGNVTNSEEANALNQTLNMVVPSAITCDPNLNTPRTNQPNMQFEINMIGNMTDCNFYIPDETGDNTGMAFRVAYKMAKQSQNNKELCASVGSMLCSVVPGFRNTVVTTLKLISVRPCFVSLPSQADAHFLVDSELPRLDWPSILVIFGYCILLLFKLNSNNDAGSFETYISNCIRGLKAKVAWDPSNELDIPFDAPRANAVSSMLGSRDLRSTAITFLMNNCNHPDSQICNVCKYLNIILSWSEMLVTTSSPVLYDPRVLLEVGHFAEAFTAVLSHPFPQYFRNLGLVSELLNMERSKFPTLFAVVQELQRGGDGSNAVGLLANNLGKKPNDGIKFGSSIFGSSFMPEAK